MLKPKRDWLYLFLLSLVTCTIFYGYYLATHGTGLDIVYKNWDGPSYVLAAMSLYKPEIAYQNNFIHSPDIHPDWTWLPAHFPLLPLLIRAFSFLGYFQAMLAISVIFTTAALITLYELIRALKITRSPLLVAIPFLFLSPRWFAVSHVGNSESSFMFFLLLFLLYFHRGRHWPAAVAASLAQLSRSQGSLIGLGLGIVALVELIKTRDLRRTVATYYPYLLIPFTLALIFLFYKIQTGNFFAFFPAIALTNNIQPIPFNTFSFPNRSIETFWQEINAVDYVVYLAAALIMFRKKFWRYGVLALTYFIPLIFLQHSDVSRYAIPMLPFAFIAYSEIIEKKEFTLATLLMSPAVILYALNFLDHNHGA